VRNRPDLLFFDPYLTTLGGGEKYLLAFAEAAKPLAASVTIAAPEVPPRRRMAEFGLPQDFRFETLAMRQFPAATKSYDGVIYLTNSIPRPSSASKSLLVVQFPFRPLPPPLLMGARRRATSRLGRYRCVVYSEFCRYWLRRRWGQDAVVLPPPIQLGAFTPDRKRPTILSVGRFFSVQHSKRQDVLVDAFSRLPEAVRNTWKLVLVGGVGDDPSSQRYLQKVRDAAARVGSVEVRTNVAREELDRLYDEASLFWHATGYGRAASAPGRAEHFGMTTVEAMSYGAVPLVYGDGAQPEIVRTCGYTWQTIDELVGLTSRLATDASGRADMARRSEQESRRFDERYFRDRVRDLLAATDGSA
jgi:glycosyltransferase involved in cell wall biosynthesis